MTNIIHGDVNLLHTTLPATAKPVDLAKTNSHKRGVWIELGEHSGNAHVVAPTKGGTIQFYLDGEEIYLEVKEAPAIITHEEHAPLIINPGIYRKMIEWEYDPFAKVIQRVVD